MVQREWLKQTETADLKESPTITAKGKKASQFVRMGTKYNESERLIVRTALGSGQALEPNLINPCIG
jgi:hypothetical protein